MCAEGKIDSFRETNFFEFVAKAKSFRYYYQAPSDGGLAQLGERLPYKQRVSGSSPLASTIADLAQLVEQLTCNQ